MNSEPLLIPRRLAIQLLAHAQQLPAGEGIQGVISGTSSASLRFLARELIPDPTAWASVRPQSSQSTPNTLPDGAPRLLTVALDTKGVLQLRCWEAANGKPVERILKIQS